MTSNLLAFLLRQYELNPDLKIQNALRLVNQEDAWIQAFAELTARIEQLLQSRGQVLMAIDGNSCSGKSTLASLLDKIFPCNIFHMDDFFLPREIKTPERLAQPGGNVHYERFIAEVLAKILENRQFGFRPYNCSRQALDEEVIVTPKQLNIIEGSYSLHPSLTVSYELKVFLTVSPEEQSRRILKRNGPVMHKRFLEEWVPLENKYFQDLKIQSQCDIVFA